MSMNIKRRQNGAIEVTHNGVRALYSPKVDAFVSRVIGPKEEMLRAARKWVAENPEPRQD